MFRPLDSSSLGPRVPRLTRPLNDASLRRRIPNRCVPSLERIEILVVTCQFDTMYVRLRLFTTLSKISQVCIKGSGLIGQGRIFQGRQYPRDALSEGQNIRNFWFRDTLVGDEMTLHLRVFGDASKTTNIYLMNSPSVYKYIPSNERMRG
jgi:hypothetical protein